MLIYAPLLTPRLRYTMDVMIGILLQTNFRLTDDKEEYEQYQGVKFAYCTNEMKGLRFTPAGLLSESGINLQNLERIEWKKIKLFFPVQGSLLPFDPFAVGFYLVSRYEEYLSDVVKDEHGRFDIRGSVSWQNGFHRKPVVNIIANEIGEIICREYPAFEYERLPFRLLRTYDVDIAYQYKGKTAFRFAGSLLKSLFKADFHKAKKLLQVLFGRNLQDEFDTFEQHRQIAIHEQSRPIHFILTAPFGKYDRNINPNGKTFAKLIRQLSEFSEIGLHPSYHSSEKPAFISKEKQQLESVCGFSITRSRQHFLRFCIPETFLSLIKSGITDDYSLGWPNEVGFRASIATPFPFFNLLTDEITALQLHPLTIMDGALSQITSSEKEKEEIVTGIIDEVKISGGEVILLKHNSN